MQIQVLRLVGFALLLAMTGCASTVATGVVTALTSSPATQPAEYPVVAEFHRQLTKNGSITFRSNEGKAYRMDCDLEITFFPDGKSHVFFYELSREGYTGSYQIDESARIVAEFKPSSEPTLAFRLTYDERSLLLRPADHHTRYVMGGDQGFWPFRPISGEDEREVLARVRADMPTPP